MTLRQALLPLVAIVLAGCFPDGASQTVGEISVVQMDEHIIDTDQVAVVAMASSDFQTSDIAVYTTDSNASIRLKQEMFATTELTDIAVSTFGNQLYREGRFQSDNLTRYSLSATQNPTLVWQKSLLGDDSSANPYTLAFKSATRAYVVRYGATDLWIIDPAVVSSDAPGFRLGEIDLSDYAHDDSGGTPRMNDALLVGDTLYVLMERLNANFTAVEQSYLAVIDTNTNQEIDTNSGSGLKGIELPVRNAANLSYHDGNLYVAGRGNTAFGATEDRYTGGIATVDVSNYSTRLLIDDGDDSVHPYGQFQRVEVVDASHGYFVGSVGYGNDTLYHFNPSSPTQISAVGDLSGINIADIKALTLSDSEARYKKVLHVAVQAASAQDTGRIEVVNVLDQSVFATVNLRFNPTDIEFMDR